MGEFTFVQLAGAQKVLKLSDASAPHGRPRKGAVVRDGVELREAAVYYPGNDQPTRHLFGTKIPDMELTGYLRDRYLGAGGAINKKEEIKAFVADAQRVRITWDDILSYNGLITLFDPGNEARGEIEWKMKIKLDVDNYANSPFPPVVPRALVDYTGSLLAWIIVFNLMRDLTGLKGSIFDLIDSVIGVITGLVGQIQSIANDVQNFETATIGQLNRIVGVAGQLNNAIFTFREAFASVGPDIALVRQNADRNAALFGAQVSLEDAMRHMLKDSADLARQAKQQALGKIRTTYIAKQGDTWESIAIAFYGSPSRAPDLQLANDGVSLAAGVEVRVPV